jgi:hypothetical protein
MSYSGNFPLISAIFPIFRLFPLKFKTFFWAKCRPSVNLEGSNPCANFSPVKPWSRLGQAMQKSDQPINQQELAMILMQIESRPVKPFYEHGQGTTLLPGASASGPARSSEAQLHVPNDLAGPEAGATHSQSKSQIKNPIPGFSTLLSRQ